MSVNGNGINGAVLPAPANGLSGGPLTKSTKRVVSLLPSATELIAAAGGAHLLVGRNHEDDYPASITHLPILTGQRTTFTTSADVNNQVTSMLEEGKSLYTLDVPLLKSLAPDVILTQSLCDVCAIEVGMVYKVAKQMQPEPLVVTLNPQSLTQVLDNLTEVGQAVGIEEYLVLDARKKLEERIQRAIKIGQEEKLKRQNSNDTNTKKEAVVAFAEWLDPIYPAGHWSVEMIYMSGAIHPLNPPKVEGGHGGYSLAIPAEKVIATPAPDLIISAPCGLDMEANRRELDKLVKGEVQEGKWWDKWMEKCVEEKGKKPRVVMVDGNQMFNRPGPRLVDALEWLVGLIWDRPDLIPKDFPWEEYHNY